MDKTELKELEWIGSSRKDLQTLPLPVRRVFGYALYAVQLGVKPPDHELDLIRERLKRAEILYTGKSKEA
jgi:hypothetical protein